MNIFSLNFVLPALIRVLAVGGNLLLFIYISQTISMPATGAFAMCLAYLFASVAITKLGLDITITKETVKYGVNIKSLLRGPFLTVTLISIPICLLFYQLTLVIFKDSIEVLTKEAILRITYIIPIINICYLYKQQSKKI